MKAPTCLVLLCVAVAVSATRTKHQAGHGSNTEDNPGKGRRPGQQIGSPDDGSTSQSFSSNDRGSQRAGSVLGGSQALHDGKEDRHNVGSQIRTNENQGTNIGSGDISSQPLTDMFQNIGNSGAGESATNSGQSGAPPNGNGGLEDLSRAYRDDYRPRGPVRYDRQNSQGEGGFRRPSWRPEESQGGEQGEQNGRRYGRPSWRLEDRQGGEGEQNGRRYGRPSWRPEDSQGGEGDQNGRRYRPQQWEDYIQRSEAERPQYDRRFRPRYSRTSEEYDSRSREEYDSRSSEEYRPRRGSGRPYRRRSGDDSREDQSRPQGQRRLGAFEGFERSG